MKRLVLTAAVLAAASPALAQGSRSHGVPPIAEMETHAVYRTFDGVLLEIDGEEGYAILQNEETGDAFRIALHDKVKLRADKGSRLRGVKDLELDDFLAGERVRFTVRTRDSKLVELKLRKPPKGTPGT